MNDLTTALQAWQQALKRTYCLRTCSAYVTDIGHLVAYLNIKSNLTLTLAMLAQLTPEAVEDYCQYRRQQGHKPASLARLTCAIRSFFRFLDQHAGIHNAALLRLPTPKVPVALPPPLSQPVATHILSRVADLHDASWQAARDTAVVMLMYSGGLKLGEVLALTRGHWQQDHVRVEGRRSRQVALPESVQQVLHDYVRTCPHPLPTQEALFVGLHGKPLNPGVVQRQLRRLRYLLGLPSSTTPSGLRRCLAAHLQSAGYDLRAIQQILGHAYLATTRRYTHS